MATTADKSPPTAGGESAVTTPPLEMAHLQSKASSAGPVKTELESHLQDSAAPTSSAAPQPTAPSTDASQHPPAQALGLASTTNEEKNDAPSEEPSALSAPSESHSNPAPAPALNRIESEAIGPSSENLAAKADLAAGPAVVITLLLASGARHPYKIDERYLKKRNVSVEGMDPFNVSVYTLKELILRDWREEWEPKPSAPSSIRLIYMGRMLDDRDKLKECRFNEAAPNVVHMTIKPQELIDDEEAAKTGKNSRDRDGEEPTARCGCVIL